MNRRRAGALAAGLLLLAVEPVAAAGDAEGAGAAPRGPHLAVAAGMTQIFDPDLQGLYSIAWQDRHGAWRASPWVFAEATARDRFFGFGALLDIPAGSRCLVTPSLAVAIYHEHDGLGLGSMFEFRSGLELSWSLRPAGREGTGGDVAAGGVAPASGWRAGRIGAAFLHYSNARVDADRNPGTEALLVTWTMPLGRRTRVSR